MLSFKVYIALFLAVALTIVDAAPFNAVGPFYNGNAASAPSFDIQVQLRLRGMSIVCVHVMYITLCQSSQEHLWPGLTVKSFSLGGR